MEFEVHGFEDEYANDGKVLVNLGNDVVEYYALNPNNLGDYQMIVVPSANPDGVIEGVNNTRVGNGYCFGRCTAAGYDMNRDFRNGYFQAQETQSLKSSYGTVSDGYTFRFPWLGKIVLLEIKL